MGDIKIQVKKDELSITVLLQERRTENEYQLCKWSFSSISL